MSQTGTQPRGSCPGCGRDFALRADGRIRHHREPFHGIPRGLFRCPGVGSLPNRPAAETSDH